MERDELRSIADGGKERWVWGLKLKETQSSEKVFRIRNSRCSHRLHFYGHWNYACWCYRSLPFDLYCTVLSVHRPAPSIRKVLLVGCSVAAGLEPCWGNWSQPFFRKTKNILYVPSYNYIFSFYRIKAVAICILRSDFTD